MLDMIEHRHMPDEKVIFYDGFLYIISQTREPCIENNFFIESEYNIDVICLNGEFDAPVSLSDIAEKYPKVNKVIYESPLNGSVYNYGNHGKDGEMWEKVGTTKGYA